MTRFLAEEFGNVHLSIEPDQIVLDFEASRPSVLVLAFERLDAAQAYRNRLFRSSRLAHLTPLKTVVLCDAIDLQRACDCCKAGAFDDYVLFWPQPYDGPRLGMAIHQALRQLPRNSAEVIDASQWATHAREIAHREPALAQHAHRFAHEVDKTRAALAAAARTADPTIQRRYGQVGQSVDALCEAARALAGALGPQLQAARAMRALAERVRPTVLVVEDDAFEQTLVARLLEETKVEIISASTGAQAFSSIWIRRPDLVLIDVDLPDVNGIEVTRRIKSVKPLARIPVVHMAACGRRAVVMESLKAGAAGFIVKPLRRATLLDKLEALLPGSVTA